MKRDKKSWVAFFVFFVAIVISVLVTFQKIVIKKDYSTQIQVDCDPGVESCFVYNCDPELEECTGDPNKDTWYYKIVSRKGFNVRFCDVETEDCPLLCEEGGGDCEVILCDPNENELVKNGVSCSDLSGSE